LLRAPLRPQQRTGLRFHPVRKRSGVEARLRAFASKFTGLFRSAASTPRIATLFANDRGLVASKQSGNLSEVVPRFHKAMNLIYLNLPNFYVIYQATSTCRSESLEY